MINIVIGELELLSYMEYLRENTSVGNFTDSTRIGAAHRCTMFLCHLDLEINTENSEYRNPNDNYNTKIMRQFTRIGGTFTSTVLGFKYMHSQFAAARVPSLDWCMFVFFLAGTVSKFTSLVTIWKEPWSWWSTIFKAKPEIPRLARVPGGSAPAEIDQLWTWRSTVSCYLRSHTTTDCFTFLHLS